MPFCNYLCDMENITNWISELNESGVPKFTEKNVNGKSLWIHCNDLQDESNYADLGYTFEELELLFKTLNGMNYMVDSSKIFEI